jgi:hypothetical protein
MIAPDDLIGCAALPSCLVHPHCMVEFANDCRYQQRSMTADHVGLCSSPNLNRRCTAVQLFFVSNRLGDMDSAQQHIQVRIVMDRHSTPQLFAA